MTDVVTSRDNKPVLRKLIRALPDILTGKTQDEYGIAEGFKLRIGFKILQLIKDNFEELSRGGQGVDGNRWPPLTKAYLAYGRRFGKGEQAELKKQAGLGKGHRFAPGDKKKGLMTAAEYREWRRIFATRKAMYLMRGHSEPQAGAHAAAVAWIIMKEKGAKTKLEVFGNRQAQILVDTGRGRNSLTPGTLSEAGAKATYSKPSGKGGNEQEFNPSGDTLVVGTNVKYMSAHHNAKKPSRRRRLWPEKFPKEWWEQILGLAISGLERIGELVQGGGVR